jgi:splicing factor 3B subunit 4
MAQQIERNQDATVYVGNLDERCTETLVWELMLQAGPVGKYFDPYHSPFANQIPINLRKSTKLIVNVHLPKDRVTQSHQGYGFCEFMTEEDADYAIRIMNQIKLYGKPIRVNKVLTSK